MMRSVVILIVLANVHDGNCVQAGESCQFQGIQLFCVFIAAEMRLL